MGVTGQRLYRQRRRIVAVDALQHPGDTGIVAIVMGQLQQHPAIGAGQYPIEDLRQQPGAQNGRFALVSQSRQ